MDLLTSTSAEAADEQSQGGLQAALFNTARMDLGTRAATRPLLERVQARTAGGEDLEPQLAANLAIELAAAGQDRDGATRSARAALTAIPLLMSVSAAALPETISVLLFADDAAGARTAAREWLQLARQQGSLPSAAVAEGFASLVALYGGEVSESVAYGLQGMAGTPNIWISTIVSSFVVRALIDRGELAQASSLLADHGLTGELPPSWPHNLVRHARGCLHAATGDHAAAVRDLLAAGEQADRWGIPNPAILPWRSDAALALAAIGDQDRAGGWPPPRWRRPARGEQAARSASRCAPPGWSMARPGRGCWPRRWMCCGPRPRRSSWPARSSIWARPSAGPVPATRRRDPAGGTGSCLPPGRPAASRARPA